VFISGDIGDDGMTGSGGIDTMNGGDGTDTIVAGAGADVINGDAGNDRITGGTGADNITGGTGNDVFSYAAGDSVVAANASTGFDTITDFAANTSGTTNGDRINIGAAAAFTAGVNPGTFATVGTSLSADLTAAFANTTLTAANQVGTINITGAVAWAGNYIVIGDATAGYNAADTVIKVNNLTNVTAANIANVIGNF
jgi:Ca2+-binding RTX toxin-like protein